MVPRRYLSGFFLAFVRRRCRAVLAGYGGKAAVFSGGTGNAPWSSPQRGRLKKAQSPPPAHPHITKNSSHTGVSRCGCCCLLVLARPRRMQTRTLQSGRENTNEGFATSFAKTMFTEHILTFVFDFVKQFSKFFELFLTLPRRCAKSAPAPPRRAGRTSAARRTL